MSMKLEATLWEPLRHARKRALERVMRSVFMLSDVGGRERVCVGRCWDTGVFNARVRW